MFDLLKNLNPSDWILLATFLAILWYSWETRQLRKWQKLQALLSIFFEQTKDWDSGMKVRTDYPYKIQEIVRTNKYDPGWAYSPAWRENNLLKDGLYRKISAMWK